MAGNSIAFSFSSNGPVNFELPPVRRDLDGMPPIEERKCPVSGCDSSGHLGGRLDRHFLVEACPVYHNMTRKECKDFRQEINRKMTARKKALNAMAAKSPLQSQTQQQRAHAKAVSESAVLVSCYSIFDGASNGHTCEILNGGSYQLTARYTRTHLYPIAI